MVVKTISLEEKDAKNGIPILQERRDYSSTVSLWKSIYTTTFVANLVVIIPYVVMIFRHSEQCSTNVYIILCLFLQLLINVILASTAQTSQIFKGYTKAMRIFGLASAMLGIVIVGIEFTNIGAGNSICIAYMTYGVGAYCAFFIVTITAGLIATRSLKNTVAKDSLPLMTPADV